MSATNTKQVLMLFRIASVSVRHEGAYH